MTPQEVHRLYQARNSSETEYMIVKTQLGYGKIRIHATRGVQSKFLIGFIASCIRYELQKAAEYVNRTTNDVIQEVNMLSMTKVNDSYVPIQGIVGRQSTILEKLGSSIDILAQIAKDENDRLAGRHPAPRHRKTEPEKSSTSKKASTTSTKTPTPAKTSVDDSNPKKPGVKRGTKRSDTNKDGSPRKKPGIPKGTKRSEFNKDGNPRKKPGPKPKTIT